MNAVFHCPSCNAPLGTLENPSPEPLPACTRCGWTPVPKVRIPGAPVLVAGAAVAGLLGVGAGWIVGHSLLLILPALIVFGPMATVGVARLFPHGWFLYNLTYSAGFIAAILLLPDGQTLVGKGWYFPAYVSLGSLLLGWLVGWLKHTD